MRPRAICALSVVSCVLLFGCSAADISGAWGVITPANLDGTWQRLGEVPGSGEVWQLTMTGNTVTGTGTWSGEACCDGTLTVSGSAAGDSLHVDVTLTTTAGVSLPPRTYHFDGALVADTLLVGANSTADRPSELRKVTPRTPLAP